MRARVAWAVIGGGILAGASAAWAGMTYTAVTQVEGEKGPAAGGAMTVQASVEGDKAKIDIQESGNPMMRKGSYLLTQDAGKTMLLVNPDAKTYMTWDLQALMGSMAMMKDMMKIVNPKVEKIAEKPGEPILGYPIVYYKFLTTYSMEVNVFGNKSATTISKEQEVWCTPKLTEAALAAWGRQQVKTGLESLDALIKVEFEKIKGFPLKQTSVTTTTDAQGKTHVTKNTMQVKEVKEGKVAASVFELPADYKEEALLAGLGGAPGGKTNQGVDINALMKQMQQMQQQKKP